MVCLNLAAARILEDWNLSHLEQTKNGDISIFGQTKTHIYFFLEEINVYHISHHMLIVNSELLLARDGETTLTWILICFW
jgi:hypothetical protein